MLAMFLFSFTFNNLKSFLLLDMCITRWFWVWKDSFNRDLYEWQLSQKVLSMMHK